MNKSLGILLLVFLFAGQLAAQKYFSKTGEISFFSDAPMEDIQAKSNSASTVLDLATGKVQWAVLIKSFEFEKALMQEHFNENYMESHEYPKAQFKGEIVNIESLDLTKDGDYIGDVRGELEIRGIKKPVETKASFIVYKGKISAASELIVKVEDYNIEIPSIVRDKIAKQIELTITAEYEKLD